jgi:hypothetical protein
VGLDSTWIEALVGKLLASGIQVQQQNVQSFTLLILNERLVLNLIPIPNSFGPQQLIALQQSYQERGLLLIQLWADIWVTKKEQVLSRLNSLLSKNKRLHGRKTQVTTLDQGAADVFLSAHHVHGTVKARYKFGLLHAGELVAVATFSGTRPMPSRGPDHRSAELVRFACVAGVTVVGGLSKLLQHYISIVKPNDVMSYADRDWSDGRGYASCGFVLEEVQEPSYMFLDPLTLERYFAHRKPEEAHGLVEIFNTGNLKYILYL